MSEKVINLFVYGTLMPGESNYRQIEDYVIDHKPGVIEGVLVDLGAFPALISGEGLVKGILLRLDRKALEITDRIEGYREDQKHCLYFREKIKVQADGDEREIEAWTYIFANPDGVADYPRLVVGELNGKQIQAWPSLGTGCTTKASTPPLKRK